MVYWDRDLSLPVTTPTLSISARFTLHSTNPTVDHTEFTVLFMNEGTLLWQTQVIEGTAVEWNFTQRDVPSKASPDNAHEYVFLGFGLGGVLVLTVANPTYIVTQNVTLTAVFELQPLDVPQYTVSFLNGDGGLLYSVSGPAGTRVEGFTPTNIRPTKAPTANYTYEWDGGWDKTFPIIIVDGNITVRPVFIEHLIDGGTETPRYTLTFVDGNGRDIYPVTVERDSRVTSYDFVQYGIPAKADETLNGITYRYIWKGLVDGVYDEATANEFGWSRALPYTLTTSDISLVAQYHRIQLPPDNYTVTFVRSDGALILTMTVARDGTVRWEDEHGEPLSTPAMSTEDDRPYTFIGWRLNGVAVTLPYGPINDDLTFVAQFTIEPPPENLRTVTFRNTDASFLVTYEAELGAEIVYSGATPTKAPAQDGTTYTFKWWSLTDGGVKAYDLDAHILVTGDLVFYAVFNAIEPEREYTITFVNGNGTVIYTIVKVAGAEVTFNLSAHENQVKSNYEGGTGKRDDADGTYYTWGVEETVNGATVIRYWDRELPYIVANNMTFTALYTPHGVEVPRYTITFVDGNGQPKQTIYNVAHGTLVTYDLAQFSAPTKDTDPDGTYYMWTNRWSVSLPYTAVANLTITALFDSFGPPELPPMRTIVWVGDNGIIYQTTARDGAEIYYDFAYQIGRVGFDANGWPIKATSSTGTTYTFAGWSIAGAGSAIVLLKDAAYTVVGNVTLNAEFTASEPQVTVTWFNGSTPIYSRPYDIGATVTYDLSYGTPTKPSDGYYRYTFVGWSRTVPFVITQDVSVSAVFDAEAINEETETPEIYIVRWVSGTTVLFEEEIVGDGENQILGYDTLNHPTPQDYETENYRYTWGVMVNGVMKYWNKDFPLTVLGDVTISALFTETPKTVEPPPPATYQVTFLDGQGNELYSFRFEVGSNVTFDYVQTLPRNYTDGVYNYTWKGYVNVGGQLVLDIATANSIGWNRELPYVMPAQDINIIAEYVRTVITPSSYTVTFADYNGTVLLTKTVAAGGNVDYVDASGNMLPLPTRDNYVFNIWTLNGSPTGLPYDNVNDNLTFVASYTYVGDGDEPTLWTVTFRNGDWSVSYEVDDGMETSFTGAVPTKPAESDGTTYTFKWWSLTVDGDKAYDLDAHILVTENLTFYAVINVITPPVKHRVSWLRGDGTVIYYTEEFEGATVTYNETGYGVPTKAADANYSYVFREWEGGSATVTVGTMDMSIRSLFTAIPHPPEPVTTYEVRWVGYNGYGILVVFHSERVEPGTEVRFEPTGAFPYYTQTISGTEYTFTFIDFSNCLFDSGAYIATLSEDAEGDLVCMANYDRQPSTGTFFTVTWFDGDGNEIYHEPFILDHTLVASDYQYPTAPTKADTQFYSYVFDYWYIIVVVGGEDTYVRLSDGVTVRSDLLVYSAFREVPRVMPAYYDVTFVDGDGVRIYAINVAGGTTVSYNRIEYPSNPTKANNEAAIYHFNGTFEVRRANGTVVTTIRVDGTTFTYVNSQGTTVTVDNSAYDLDFVVNENLTVQALFDREVISAVPVFTVIWRDDDGNELRRQEVTEGFVIRADSYTIPPYERPTKTATADARYDWNGGWFVHGEQTHFVSFIVSMAYASENGINGITGIIYIVADFDNVAYSYVTYLNWDESELYVERVEAGGKIAWGLVEENKPTKDTLPNGTYYDFRRWVTEDGTPFDENTIINGNITLIAEFYEMVPNAKYTVIFVRDDGTEITRLSLIDAGTYISFAQTPWALVNGIMPSKVHTTDPENRFWVFREWDIQPDAGSSWRVTGNMTITALFDEGRYYKVIFRDGDGNDLLLGNGQYYVGQLLATNTVTYSGATPTKTDKNHWVEYYFTGFDKGSPYTVVATDAENYVIVITALFNERNKTLPDIVVTFRNHDNTSTIDIQYVADIEGGYSGLIYGGIAPTKPSTYENNYIFIGWKLWANNALGDMLYTDATLLLYAVTGAVTFVAQFDPDPIIRYTVIFTNWNNVELARREGIIAGTFTSFNGNPTTPVRPADDLNTYLFSGWIYNGENIGIDLSQFAINGNWTLKADYDATPKATAQWTLTFKNWDNTTLYTALVRGDATGHSYPSDTNVAPTPTKPSDDDFNYIFEGRWRYFVSYDIVTGVMTVGEYVDMASLQLTGNLTIVADFRAVEKNKYTVTFVNYDETTVLYELIESVEEGSFVVYGGLDPTKPEIPKVERYYFNGWRLLDGTVITLSLYAITGDTTFVAVFGTIEYLPTYYDVTFKNYDGDILYTATDIEEGHVGVTYGASNPTKPYGPSNPLVPNVLDSKFTFVGWKILMNAEDGTLGSTLYTAAMLLSFAVTEDVTFVAQYTESARLTFTVTFEIDGDINNAATQLVYEGDTALYDEETFGTPVKPTDQMYKYTFAGWSLDGETVIEDYFDSVKIMANTPFIAVFIPTKLPNHRSTVTFTDYNGDILAVVIVGEGSLGVIFEDANGDPLPDPVRADDDNTYVFSGWKKWDAINEEWLSLGKDLSMMTISSDITLVAEYAATPKGSWTVDFMDSDDETVFRSIFVRDGLYAVYNTVSWGNPEKADAEVGGINYRYTFAGWSLTSGGAVVDLATYRIVKDEVFYAVYTALRTDYPPECAVTFINYDYNMLYVAVSHETDIGVTYEGDTPVKPSVIDYTYDFIGWTIVGIDGSFIARDALATLEITGDMTLMAVFNAVEKDKFLVRFYWNDEAGTVLGYNVYDGAFAVYDAVTPEKESDDDYRYTFAGWTKANGTAVTVSSYAITEATEFYATYTPVLLTKYSVVFKNANNTTLQTSLIAEGKEGIAFNGATPTLAHSNNLKRYNFEGWATLTNMQWWSNTLGFKGTDAQLESILVTLSEVVVTDDITLYAIYKEVDKVYFEVEFYDGDGKLYDTIYGVFEGTFVTFDTTAKPLGRGTPTKADTELYRYIFDGWSLTPDGEKVNLAATPISASTKVFYAIFIEVEKKFEKFIVTYKKYDGSVFETEEVNAGFNPTFNGIPEKPQTLEYTYEFMGWCYEPDSIAGVPQTIVWYVGTASPLKITEDITLYPYFIAHERGSHIVTFMSYDGSEELWSGEVVEQLTTPTDVAYPRSLAEPTRPRTATQYYEFTGWSLEPNGVAINIQTIPVTKDLTFYAAFVLQIRDGYIVSFENYEGTKLCDDVIVSAENVRGVTYTGARPAKPHPVAELMYAFDGFAIYGTDTVVDLATLEINKDYRLVAVFTERLRDTFTVTFKNDDGKILTEIYKVTGVLEMSSINYDYTKGVPYRKGDDKHAYRCNGWYIVEEDGTRTFIGWNLPFVLIERDTVFIASYEEVGYLVTFVQDDGKTVFTTLVVVEVTIGIACPADKDPTKLAEGIYRFIFMGWSLDGENVIDLDDLEVSGNMTLIAVYKKVLRNTVTVIFQNEDGTEICKVTVLEEDYVEYDEMEYGTPEKEPSDEDIENNMVWVFDGWYMGDKHILDLSTVQMTEDTVLVAAFRQVPAQPKPPEPIVGEPLDLNNWIWWLIGGMALSVIIALIVFGVRSARDKREERDDD